MNKLFISTILLLLSLFVQSQSMKSINPDPLEDVSIGSMRMNINITSSNYYIGEVVVTNNLGQVFARVSYNGNQLSIPISGPDNFYDVELRVGDFYKINTVHLYNPVEITLQDNKVKIETSYLQTGSFTVVNNLGIIVDSYDLQNDITEIDIVWTTGYYTLRTTVNGNSYIENLYINNSNSSFLNVYYNNGNIVFNSTFQTISSILVRNINTGNIIYQANNINTSNPLPIEWNEGNYSILILTPQGEEFQTNVYVPNSSTSIGTNILNTYYDNGEIIINSSYDNIDNITIQSPNNGVIFYKNNAPKLNQIPIQPNWEKGLYKITITVERESFENMVYVPEINNIISIANNNETDFSIFSQNNNLIVNLTKLPATISVYDMNGKKLFDRKLLNFSNSFQMPKNGTSNYYLIKISNNKQSKVEKVFIK